MVKRKKKNFWKPVEINLEHAPELICFEELTDYSAVRGKDNVAVGDDDNSERASVQKTKSRKRKTDTTSAVSLNKKMKSSIDRDQPKNKKGNKVVTNTAKSEETIAEPGSPSSLDMSAWDEFDLPESIIRALSAKKFTSPTDIQVCIE